MNTQLKWTLALLLLGGAASSNSIGGTVLNLGDAAPALEISKWVQGEPVKAFEPGKVYIVEFWATWCGPCRVSIPHLNEIHTKYKDKGLVVIGQDVWERDTSLVVPFVEKMGDKMTYRVALDSVTKGSEGEKGKMAEGWMEAAGERGIPAAFVVNQQGKIAWIGHPMQLKDETLDQIIDGKWDLEQKAVERLDRKEKEAKLQPLWQAMYQHIRKEQWDEADAKLKDIAELLPKAEREDLASIRFQILIGKQDFAAAYRLANDYSEAHPDDASGQNTIAWEIVTNKKIKERDLDLAKKLATRANQAAKEKDSAILDTLARVLFLQGEKDKAIELQRRAVSLAADNSKQSLQKVLDSYVAGKVPGED